MWNDVPAEDRAVSIGNSRRSDEAPSIPRIHVRFEDVIELVGIARLLQMPTKSEGRELLYAAVAHQHVAGAEVNVILPNRGDGIEQRGRPDQLR